MTRLAGSLLLLALALFTAVVLTVAVMRGLVLSMLDALRRIS